MGNSATISALNKGITECPTLRLRSFHCSSTPAVPNSVKHLSFGFRSPAIFFTFSCRSGPNKWKLTVRKKRTSAHAFCPPGSIVRLSKRTLVIDDARSSVVDACFVKFRTVAETREISNGLSRLEWSNGIKTIDRLNITH